MAASFIDNRGNLFADCSECARTLCAQAWKKDIPFLGGCYNGILHHRICKTSLSNLAKTEQSKIKLDMCGNLQYK